MELPHITPLEKYTAQRIVNIHETGSLEGDYSSVWSVRGDANLRYGRAQVSLAKGHLGRLVSEYCESPRARQADSLRPCLDRLQAGDATLANDLSLRNALVLAGADPVMRDIQDNYFDELFWNPALEVAAGNYLRTPLAVAIMLDSYVQGGWNRLKMNINLHHGRPPTIREECWLEFYVRARQRFLTNGPFRGSEGRMNVFLDLIGAGNWSLRLPVVVRGISIPAEAIPAAA